MGDDARGIIVSQIAPSPTSGTTAVAREFQTDIKASGRPASYAAMEGYMAARVLVEGMKRAGKNPTRRTGSEFTELSIIGANGQFIR